MHPLLAEQIRQHLGDAPADGRVAELLAAVSASYQSSDDARQRLQDDIDERSAALLLDIARRDRAEGERDAFFQTSLDLLCILDERLLFSQLNPSWERTLGHPTGSLAGRAAIDFIHPEDHEAVSADELRAAGQLAGRVCRVRAADGTWRWISWAATWDRQRRLIFAIGRDVTAEREMARELAQAQKLEAIGQLASGVAHEINTPIQFIGDNLSFLTQSFRDLDEYLAAIHQVLTPEQRARLAEARKKADYEYLEEEVPRSLSESKDGVRRVAELVRALKEFAHPDTPEKAPADLNRALERSVVLARGELKHLATVDLQLSPLPPVLCHVGGLSQVFLNLLVNAAHAIEERAAKDPGGARKITVTTQLVNGEVSIAIADTGCGIPEALRERIFEPFFTTKPMGKGSGQGLPLVRNVVIGQHQGRVDIDSEVGRGTTFTLRLPVGTVARQEAA